MSDAREALPAAEDDAELDRAAAAFADAWTGEATLREGLRAALDAAGVSALRAEVERLREGAGRALVDRDAYRAELDETRQQVADLRAGIEALLPGETVNVYAGGGNLVSQRRVVDPDHLRTLLAGSGEQPGECTPCDTCGRDQRFGWCLHDRPAPVAPDVVRELDAVMHHHADRADAAEAEADRLAALLDVAQEDLAAAEAPVAPDSADALRERVAEALWNFDRPVTQGWAEAVRVAERNVGGYTAADVWAYRSRADAVLAVVRPRGQEGS